MRINSLLAACERDTQGSFQFHNPACFQRFLTHWEGKGGLPRAALAITLEAVSTYPKTKKISHEEVNTAMEWLVSATEPVGGATDADRLVPAFIRGCFGFGLAPCDGVDSLSEVMRMTAKGCVGLATLLLLDSDIEERLT